MMVGQRVIQLKSCCMRRVTFWLAHFPPISEPNSRGRDLLRFVNAQDMQQQRSSVKALHRPAGGLAGHCRLGYGAAGVTFVAQS